MAFAPPLPRTRKLTIIAQDPSVRGLDGKLLKTEVEIPAETLAPGPRGYRVQVIDYDTSNHILYIPSKYQPPRQGRYLDPFKDAADKGNDLELLANPSFHAQNVYAIVMRTLARFEFALGRRVRWGFDGHQINVAPHAFADANAFYSARDQALMFGYFPGTDRRGKQSLVFSCLSHDVVAHETTHALLDGLRTRYTDPSSPEQAGFHEGFADIVALLSVFSLKDVVGTLLNSKGREAGSDSDSIDLHSVEPEALRESALLGLAEEMGQRMSEVRGKALRMSAKLPPLPLAESKRYMKDPQYKEPHRRGEILVAAVMNAFLEVWSTRIKVKGSLRFRVNSKLDRQMVIEEGASAADHLLTMIIRALDYAPPTDLQFCDFLSALLTADRELVPDDSKYKYREILLNSFQSYGIEPAISADEHGRWVPVEEELRYDRTHFESMLRDPDEVFRFVWENRKELELADSAFTKIQSVRPCLRIGPDGFALSETVAEYIQMITLLAGEIETLNIERPTGMPKEKEITLYGGGALIFDEYGRLKYHVNNSIFDQERQTPRLKYLWEYGYFNRENFSKQIFSRLHLRRATNLRIHPPEDY